MLGSPWRCVPVFRGGRGAGPGRGARARSRAAGHVHLGLDCSRKVKRPARAQSYPWLPQQPSSPGSTGCREQSNSCQQRLLAHLFLKGIFAWGFFYLFGGRFFFFNLFWFPIYVITKTLSGKCHFIREKPTHKTITSLNSQGKKHCKAQTPENGKQDMREEAGGKGANTVSIPVTGMLETGRSLEAQSYRDAKSEIFPIWPSPV